MGFSEQLALANRLQTAQQELTIGVAQDVARFFPLLDVNNVDKTFGRYASALMATTKLRRQVAGNLGAAYFMATRLDAGISDDFVPETAPIVADEVLFNSLLATGPVLMKKGLGSGRTAEEVKAISLAATTGSMQRHVLNGSRETVKRLVYKDTKCNGWARVAAGSRVCWFCSMLISRGAVYKNKQTASRGVDGDPYHDHCHCYAVAVFSNGRYPGDEQAAEMQDLWYSSTEGTSGPAMRQKFRQAYNETYGNVIDVQNKVTTSKTIAAKSTTEIGAGKKTIKVTAAERASASKYRLEMTKDGLVHVNGNNDVIKLEGKVTQEETKRIVAAMEKGQQILPTRTSVTTRDARGIFAKDKGCDAYNSAAWDNKTKTWKSNNSISLNIERLRNAKAQKGYFMPARTVQNDLEYTVLHELGHSAERQFGFNGGIDGIITENYLAKMPKEALDSLSRYGKSNAQEAWAEAWAEYFMTNGATDNAAAQWFASTYEWSKLL